MELYLNQNDKETTNKKYKGFLSTIGRMKPFLVKYRQSILTIVFVSKEYIESYATIN